MYPCSTEGSPCARISSGNTYLLQHGVFCGLQRNLCSSAWSTSFPSFFSDLGAHRIVSHSFPPLLLLTVLVECFRLSYTRFPEVPLSQLLVSAVPCAGLVRAGWNWLCRARGNPGLSSPHRGHPAAPLAASAHLYPIHIARSVLLWFVLAHTEK